MSLKETGQWGASQTQWEAGLNPGLGLRPILRAGEFGSTSECARGGVGWGAEKQAEVGMLPSCLLLGRLGDTGVLAMLFLRGSGFARENGYRPESCPVERRVEGHLHPPGSLSQPWSCARCNISPATRHRTARPSERGNACWIRYRPWALIRSCYSRRFYSLI